jgi:hypothetical protein
MPAEPVTPASSRRTRSVLHPSTPVVTANNGAQNDVCMFVRWPHFGETITNMLRLGRTASRGPRTACHADRSLVTAADARISNVPTRIEVTISPSPSPASAPAPTDLVFFRTRSSAPPGFFERHPVPRSASFRASRSGSRETRRPVARTPNDASRYGHDAIVANATLSSDHNASANAGYAFAGAGSVQAAMPAGCLRYLMAKE